MVAEKNDGAPVRAPKLVVTNTFLRRGMLISFRDINYTVKNHNNPKDDIKLLSGVSGYLRPGELVALMGPSGCGKVNTAMPFLQTEGCLSRADTSGSTALHLACLMHSCFV
jgi:ABC-type glutathione transport system ATPase component